MALAEKSSLTAKQQRFVEEYLIDLNATRAAIRAGFNRSSARSQGSRLRRVPHVAKAIQEAMDCRSRRTAINQDRVLEELAAIAFADIQDYLRFGPSGEVYFDWSKLPEGATRAVAEITQDEYSEGRGSEAREVKKTRFKLHNKIPALELLGDHPAVVGTAARIGRMLALGADPKVEEGAEKRGTSGRGRDSLQKRIDSLHELQWQDPPKYASPRTQRELHDLYARLHGSEAIRDVEGRSRLR